VSELTDERLKEKAREWCKRYVPHAKKIAGVTPSPGQDYPPHERDCDRDNCAWPYRVESLTDLLARVAEQERQRAERIVREVHRKFVWARQTCDEILRRLREE
jgi:hypothetical protein